MHTSTQFQLRDRDRVGTDEPIRLDPLLRLSARCPQCGTPPAMRVTAGMVEKVAREEPTQVVGSYQCHRGRCGVIYTLMAAAYQNAR